VFVETVEFAGSTVIKFVSDTVLPQNLILPLGVTVKKTNPDDEPS
jgi:hypothetical protein